MNHTNYTLPKTNVQKVRNRPPQTTATHEAKVPRHTRDEAPGDGPGAPLGTKREAGADASAEFHPGAAGTSLHRPRGRWSRRTRPSTGHDDAIRAGHAMARCRRRNHPDASAASACARGCRPAVARGARLV